MKKPVHIVDLGDIVSAGGMGDSTIVLRALLKDTSIRPAALFITAPDMVKAAEAAGVGAVGEFTARGYVPKAYADSAGFDALGGGCVNKISQIGVVIDDKERVVSAMKRVFVEITNKAEIGKQQS
jgi:microcystin degradation protein MlrC